MQAFYPQSYPQSYPHYLFEQVAGDKSDTLLRQGANLFEQAAGARVLGIMRTMCTYTCSKTNFCTCLNKRDTGRQGCQRPAKTLVQTSRRKIPKAKKELAYANPFSTSIILSASNATPVHASLFGFSSSKRMSLSDFANVCLGVPYATMLISSKITDAR